MSPIARVPHMKLNFLFEFETANQSGFKPRSLGPKGAMLTIELHSIEKTRIVWKRKAVKALTIQRKWWGVSMPWSWTWVGVKSEWAKLQPLPRVRSRKVLRCPRSQLKLKTRKRIKLFLVLHHILHVVGYFHVITLVSSIFMQPENPKIKGSVLS